MTHSPLFLLQLESRETPAGLGLGLGKVKHALVLPPSDPISPPTSGGGGTVVVSPPSGGGTVVVLPPPPVSPPTPRT